MTAFRSLLIKIHLQLNIGLQMAQPLSHPSEVIILSNQADGVITTSILPTSTFGKRAWRHNFWNFTLLHTTGFLA